FGVKNFARVWHYEYRRCGPWFAVWAASWLDVEHDVGMFDPGHLGQEVGELILANCLGAESPLLTGFEESPTVESLAHVSLDIGRKGPGRANGGNVGFFLSF